MSTHMIAVTPRIGATTQVKTFRSCSVVEVATTLVVFEGTGDTASADNGGEGTTGGAVSLGSSTIDIAVAVFDTSLRGRLPAR